MEMTSPLRTGASKAGVTTSFGFQYRNALEHSHSQSGCFNGDGLPILRINGDFLNGKNTHRNNTVNTSKSTNAARVMLLLRFVSFLSDKCFRGCSSTSFLL